MIDFDEYMKELSMVMPWIERFPVEENGKIVVRKSDWKGVREDAPEEVKRIYEKIKNYHFI